MGSSAACLRGADAGLAALHAEFEFELEGGERVPLTEAMEAPRGVQWPVYLRFLLETRDLSRSREFFSTLSDLVSPRRVLSGKGHGDRARAFELSLTLYQSRLYAQTHESPHSLLQNSKRVPLESPILPDSCR